MSNNTSTSISAQAYQEELNLVCLMNLGFYLFDYCLTIDQQAKFLWNRKVSIPSILLAILHLSTLLSGITSIGVEFALGCKSQMAWYYASTVAAIVFNVATAEIAANMCMMVTPASAATATTAHILVLVSTWYHTFTLKKLAHTIGEQIPLTTLLLRDGTVYFGALVVVDILEIVSHYTSALIEVTELAISFTTVILSHFFLNLRNAANPSQGVTTASMSDLHFTGPNSLGGQVISNVDEDVLEEYVEDEGYVDEGGLPLGNVDGQDIVPDEVMDEDSP
ncbi:uncharacterized protein B0H18DRAFT_1188531 [Fomitopsis serialis]|uniref:uncharacterized protein n=1 Tax=Fomitopsis serialis TaxID=139415 RepID=UPI002007CBC4|nr:uncharacterized protein B0H18DRAFT_1188531 [Neoantrodia serialis]KAH9934388.1 hypothetical protein B0H18DRAFT_1188531 [Neoantrodia serialis]